MYSTKKYGIYPSLVYRFILDLYIYIKEWKRNDIKDYELNTNEKED
jgi:hypothetical protein